MVALAREGCRIERVGSGCTKVMVSCFLCSASSTLSLTMVTEVQIGGEMGRGRLSRSDTDRLYMPDKTLRSVAGTSNGAVSDR